MKTFKEFKEARGDKKDSMSFTYNELQYINVTDRLAKKHDLRWGNGAKNTSVALRNVKNRNSKDAVPSLVGHPNDLKAFKSDLKKALKKLKK